MAGVAGKLSDPEEWRQAEEMRLGIQESAEPGLILSQEQALPAGLCSTETLGPQGAGSVKGSDLAERYCDL